VKETELNLENVGIVVFGSDTTTNKLILSNVLDLLRFFVRERL
jgi:hypothetical protein